jgi:hypothetical protein
VPAFGEEARPAPSLMRGSGVPAFGEEARPAPSLTRRSGVPAFEQVRPGGQ